MADIKDRILADAQSRKPQYANRMEVMGPQMEGLPAGLTHYSIRIAQLYDYIPINYIVIDDDYFTSLVRGDFVRLLRRLRLIEEQKLSAADLTTLFLLIEFPSRDHYLVEKVEDLALPSTGADEIGERLAHILAPPSMRTVNGRVECTFFSFDSRTRTLKRFLILISSNYDLHGEASEVINFRASSA